MNAQLTEIMRLITNLIRTGVVTEVDRENWLCRVKTGELETNWISWLTLRAGNARTWWRPSEGEQVVLLSLGGNLEIDPAVVLATRKYVDDEVLELKLYVDDQMRNHIAAQDPHTQYAQKHNPTFTGEPKAPTPAAGNNTTRIATTEFVQAAITALINGAPATLDTLKEIAAAINNDPKFSTTINNALALKAPLSSPALTGTPTAPTAAQSVNNTQIATTAFVKSAIAGMVGSAPAALDTLNELAAALGNDPNFATTMLNALAGKQPLDNTLTNLSGKDVAGLLTYLGLGELSLAGTASGVIGLNGYVTIPLIISGSRRTLIIQWGQARFGGSGGEDAGYLNDFPFAFPSACYGMIVSHVGHTPSGAGILSASAITSNQFRGFSSIATAANAVLGRYIAIGV
ncbi:phage baseplate assembly protein V [Escherichia coli]